MYLFEHHKTETKYFEYLLLFCEEIPFRTLRERNKVFRIFAVILWRITFSYTTREKQGVSSICCHSVKNYLFVHHETETRYFEYLLSFCEEIPFRKPRDRNMVFRVFAVILWRSTFFKPKDINICPSVLLIFEKVLRTEILGVLYGSTIEESSDIRWIYIQLNSSITQHRFHCV